MTIALYRRYRPETFDEVIGQDHVTEPLKAALRSNRVTHAYLFSGPRGCGKTTSARILARCLNCAEGPTDTPCGTCDSCRDLATGGPGSLDVVEIDAASHNGVDDARELRERATFAPARDRYKVFILDEAHMVTPQGFNALLKLVEEPPEHVKFVFATTEPERVIGTIRSRTHHYPFRLVPGDTMIPFLRELCDHESISVGEGVLPLVVRAGGGSVRDSLSVLDQLMAGSVDASIDYAHAISLLGYTDQALLDNTVESLAENDGAQVFSTIEQMVESGHDPRRFVEDLLQRLRDLLIVAVAGEQARDILGEIPNDQRDRMFAEAQMWGPAALSQAAELTDEALRQMVGATSPRLQLELLVGRILIETDPLAAPQSGRKQTPEGDSVEPVTDADGNPLTGAARAREEVRRIREEQRKKADVESSEKPAGASDSSTPITPEKSEPTSEAKSATTPDASQGRKQAPEAKPATTPEVVPGQDEASKEASTPAPPQSADTEPVAVSAEQQVASPAVVAAPVADSTANLHGKWDQFIDAVEQLRRATRFLLAEHATIVSEDAESVTLGFVSENLRNAFYAGGHERVAVEAIRVVVGAPKQVHTTVGNQAPVAPERRSPREERVAQPRQTDGPQQHTPSTTTRNTASDGQAATSNSSEEDDGWGPVAIPGAGLEQKLTEYSDNNSARERTIPPQSQSAIRPEPATSTETTAEAIVEPPAEPVARHESEPVRSDHAADQSVATPSVVSPESPEEEYDPTGGASVDDPDAETTLQLGLPVVEEIFGARLIEEIDEGSD